MRAGEPRNKELPAELQAWFDTLQGHWLVGEDDSPLRVTVRLHHTSQASGEKSMLRASFYRTDRAGVWNEDLKIRFCGTGCMLTLGDGTLDLITSCPSWVVWRREGQCRHWFRGQEAQMLAQWFWTKVVVQGLWLEVDLVDSLQARRDAEQGLGLLSACIRWRLSVASRRSAEGAGAGDVWARVDLSRSLVGDGAVESLLCALQAGGARCRRLSLRGCRLTAAGLEKVSEVLRAQLQPIIELDLRDNCSPDGCACSEQVQAWLRASSRLIALVAPRVSSERPTDRPLWLALDLESADAFVSLRAFLEQDGVELRREADSCWLSAVSTSHPS